MNGNTIFLILCSVGAIQSFFIGGYFVSSKRGKRLSNLLLGALFIAVAIRVAKSTLWLFYNDVSMFILNMGFGVHLVIVPLLMLYIFSFRESFRWHWYQYLHFVPGLLVLALSTMLTTSNFWYIGGYSVLLYHSLIYLVLSLYFLARFVREGGPSKIKTWLNTLYISIALFCMAYFMNYEWGLTSYMTGPVVYSAIVYFLSFYVLKNHVIFTEELKPKYRNIQLSKDDVENYTKRVKSVIEEEKLYLSPEFTLSKLSVNTKIAKHLLSNLFNVHINISFTDYTNQYRILKAKELLQDEDYDNLKISAIAYESGFNTLSAFNAAFKKNTDLTPSEYKKKLSENV